MFNLRESIVTLVAGRNRSTVPVVAGLVAGLLAILLALAGAFGAPELRGPAFDWADSKPAALTVADGAAYARDWERLEDTPYPAMSDYLADQLQANRASAAEALAEGSWQGGALDVSGLRLKGQPIDGDPDNVVRRWTRDHLCPVQGWGGSAEAIRALVARGVGECTFGQRWQARAWAFAGGSATLGWFWLSLAFFAFLGCLALFGVIILIRRPYGWLYKSRVL